MCEPLIPDHDLTRVQARDERRRAGEVDNHPNLSSDPTKPNKQRLPGAGDRRGATAGGLEGAHPHRPRRRGQRRPRQGQAGLSEEGRQILSELPASKSTRASFIILLTDTKESASFSKLARELFPKMVTNLPVVHTIALADAAGHDEHDPKALLSIAKESHGTYSFVVVDDQNAADDAIAVAVAVCVSGLKAVAAVNTHLRLDTAPGSGVRIERFESGGYKSTTAIDKTSGEITVGVLYSGEAKSFIADLHVPAAISETSNPVEGDCDKQHLLTAIFVITDNDDDDGDASSPRWTPPTTTIIKTVLSVQRPVPDYNAVTTALQKVPVPVVMDHIAQFGVLELVTTFVEKEIWGLSSLTSITAEMAAAMASKLQIKWEEFVLARQFWTGLNLATFEVEINYMVSQLLAGDVEINYSVTGPRRRRQRAGKPGSGSRIGWSQRGWLTGVGNGDHNWRSRNPFVF
ncbi:hypothetical protein HU200_016716 [Digitaria exilis]|uniref:Uncharacterized protein n=1 Tax=Digitaria exilis TaxID=1010633 RepID=A0A835F7A6_9POAL|nr:hypothetical protein HU200_016716 [Digitaria exilis]